MRIRRPPFTISYYASGNYRRSDPDTERTLASLASTGAAFDSYFEALRQLASPVLIMDSRGVIAFANDEGRKLLGYHAELSRHLEQRAPFAIFLLDLDRFKNVNDTLGHAIGDALLRKVGERLRSLGTAHDIIARLGGDEFVLLRPGITTREQATPLASRIVDLVGRAYALEGHMLNVGASVGVTLAPTDGGTSDILMKNADLALYSSKSEGRGRFCFFGPEMDARSQARRQIELDLRRALALKQLTLVYQPQIDLATHEVVGFEALLRWNNGGNIISPAAFIPIPPVADFFLPALAERGELETPAEPTTRLDWIAPQDIGAFAAAAFADPERFHGHEIDLAAESVTMDELAAKISKGTGKAVSAITSSEDDMITRGYHPGRARSWVWDNVEGYKVDLDAVRS